MVHVRAFMLETATQKLEEGNVHPGMFTLCLPQTHSSSKQVGSAAGDCQTSHGPEVPSPSLSSA